MFAGGFVVFPRRERWARRALFTVSGTAFLGLVLADVQLTQFGAQTLRQMAVVNGAGVVLLLVVVSAYNSQVIEAWERRAEAERARAEGLLLSILPERIAQLLKDDRPTIAEAYEDVTVLFCDIVEVLRLSGPLTPMEQVRLLDRLFTAFDRLAEQHGLEKIKTIGDAYMVAGGVPERREGHCEAVARMALDMLAVRDRLDLGLGEPLRLRIGIARGPVVAGVIGRQKFSYDLWGDVVNTASRMESHGLPDRIQITAEVARALQDRFQVERRGTIQVKGKGPMETWFLCGYPTTDGR
jgi:class 3 adenylate cyclase